MNDDFLLPTISEEPFASSDQWFGIDEDYQQLENFIDSAMIASPILQTDYEQHSPKILSPNINININVNEVKKVEKQPEQTGKKTKEHYPKQLRNEIKLWLIRNFLTPYPTQQEKLAWAKKYDVTLKYINTMLVNLRVRLLRYTPKLVPLKKNMNFLIVQK